MNRVTELVRILDVSGAQGPNVDFGKVKASGIAAVWLKATEGVDFVDETFFPNAQKCKEAGLRFGAYHYLRIRVGKGPDGQDAARQAFQFCEAYRKSGANCPPMLDVESGENEGVTREEVVAAVRAFLTVVAQQLSMRCIIYSSNGEWLSWGLGAETEFAAFPLWVAAIGVSSPPIPAPWKHVTAWQHTWSAQVPGIAGNVDESYWYGPRDFGTGLVTRFFARVASIFRPRSAS